MLHQWKDGKFYHMINGGLKKTIKNSCLHGHFSANSRGFSGRVEVTGARPQRAAFSDSDEKRFRFVLF